MLEEEAALGDRKDALGLDKGREGARLVEKAVAGVAGEAWAARAKLRRTRLAGADTVTMRSGSGLSHPLPW